MSKPRPSNRPSEILLTCFGQLRCLRRFLNPLAQIRLKSPRQLALVFHQPHRPGEIEAAHPDYVVILPWNIKAEVMQQLACIREWGGQFVTAIPRLEITP